jgi:hypothetical protein
MYAKPALERFGTLRELTLIGISNASDGTTILGITGSTPVICDYTGLNCPASGS